MGDCFPLTLALSPIGGEGIDEGVHSAPIFLYRPLHRLGACAAVNTQKQGFRGQFDHRPEACATKSKTVFGFRRGRPEKRGFSIFHWGMERRLNSPSP